MKVDLEAFAGHTPGPIRIEKCRCGHKACTQHTLSTQGSVGFELADAKLYAAAPDMAQEIRELRKLVKAQHEALKSVYSFSIEGARERTIDNYIDIHACVGRALTRAKEAGYV